jgi:hypothetical protein
MVLKKDGVSFTFFYFCFSPRLFTAYWVYYLQSWILILLIPLSARQFSASSYLFFCSSCLFYLISLIYSQFILLWLFNSLHDSLNSDIEKRTFCYEVEFAGDGGGILVRNEENHGEKGTCRDYLLLDGKRGFIVVFWAQCIFLVVG